MDAKTTARQPAATPCGHEGHRFGCTRVYLEAPAAEEAAPAAPAQEEFVILRNDRTSFYEVHRAGCRHQMARHLERMVTRTAESGAALAKDFEARNEDCIAKIGPCAR